MSVSLASRLAIAAMAFFAVMTTWHTSLTVSGLVA